MVDGAVQSLQSLIAPQVERMGYMLWGLECQLGSHEGRVCVYIDHPDGISHEDCAAVSDQISGLLDVADPIRTAYRLEVSSPGLDRLLLCPEHFRQYQGSGVSVRLRWPLEERRRLAGQIEAASDEVVEIREGEQVFAVPYNAIARARLHYEEE